MEEVRSLIARAQQGDKWAREILIEKNLGLVHHIARRFVGRGHPEDDLFQVGVMGLMKCIDRFDLQREVCFSTYAVPMITGEIRCFLRSDGPVKVSRTIWENNNRIRKARGKLVGQLGREPLLTEVASECGLDVEDVVQAQGAEQMVESLDQTNIQGYWKETGKGTQQCGDPEKEKLLDRLMLEQLLDGLEPRERELICLRYYRNRTQTETARILCMTQVQVSRMEKKILLRMREKAE